MLADGGANATPLLDGEPIDVSIAANVISWKMSNSFRTLWNATGSSRAVNFVSFVRDFLNVCLPIYMSFLILSLHTFSDSPST